jgi:hypothetical protein
MIASIQPRAGIAGPTSAPNQDPVNGHEWDPSQAIVPNADLQYACTFPVPAPKACTTQADCDCFVPQNADPSAQHNPLCQDSTGVYSTTQTRAKAYPGTRELQVLAGIGDQAVVSSICPSNLTDALANDFGYRPAIATLVHRMGPVLSGHLCLPQPLPVAASGLADCRLIEAFNPAPGSSCSCGDRPGRVAADPSLVSDEISQRGACLCEIRQVEDVGASELCRTAADLPDGMPSGWCYVDPAAQNEKASCKFVQSCAASDQRKLRFMSPVSAPRPGAAAFLHCSAAPVTAPASNCL